MAERVSTTRLGSKTKLSISGTDVVVNETRFSGPNTEPGEISLTMDGNSISQALSEIASQAHNFSYSIAPPNPMQRFKYEPVHISLSHATLIQAIKAVAYAARANYRFEDGTYYFELRPVQLDGAPMADGGLGGGGFGGGIDPRGGHGGTFGGGGMGGGIAPRGGQGGGFGGGGISGGQLEVPDYFRSNGGGFIGGVSTGQSTMNVSVKDTAGKPEEVTYDLNLRDCDLRGAIKMLCGRILSNLPVRRFAIKSGTNVGRITLKQDHLTFEEALTAICKASGNQYHIDPDGVVVIAPAETPTPPHT